MSDTTHEDFAATWSPAREASDCEGPQDEAEFRDARLSEASDDRIREIREQNLRRSADQ